MAALLVFFVHFGGLFDSWIPGNSLIGTAFFTAAGFGHAGVDVFFVISGFLIYGVAMQPSTRPGPFLRRRVRRLYPTFLVILSLYVTLMVAFPERSKFPAGGKAALGYLLANVLMLPGTLPIPPLITVAWSLSYEWLYYLTLPAVIVVLNLRRWKPSQRIAFFLLLLATTVSTSSYVRLTLFISGMILKEATTHYDIASRLRAWGEPIAIIAFVLNLVVIGVARPENMQTNTVLSSVPRFYAPSLCVTIPLIALYALFFDGMLRRLFSLVYLRWLGNISYSFYLIHGMTLHGLRLWILRWFPTAPLSAVPSALLFVSCLLATSVVASAMYLIVEKPLSFPNRRGSA